MTQRVLITPALVKVSRPGIDVETASFLDCLFAAGDNLVCASYMSGQTSGSSVSFGRTFLVRPTIWWIVYDSSAASWRTPYFRLTYSINDGSATYGGIIMTVTTTGFTLTRYTAALTTVRYLVTWNP